MKFLIAIFGLTTIVTSVREVASDSSSDLSQLRAYDYVLPISIVVERNIPNAVIDTFRWVDDQTVVYNQNVDDSNPIYVVGSVVNHDVNRMFAVFPTQNVLLPCGAEENGSWERVMVNTILQSLTPNNGCPIEAGQYTLDANQIFNVSATFRDIIDCGQYELNLAVIDAQYNKLVQVKYAFDTNDLSGNSVCK